MQQNQTLMPIFEKLIGALNTAEANLAYQSPPSPLTPLPPTGVQFQRWRELIEEQRKRSQQNVHRDGSR